MVRLYIFIYALHDWLMIKINSRPVMRLQSLQTGSTSSGIVRRIVTDHEDRQVLT